MTWQSRFRFSFILFALMSVVMVGLVSLEATASAPGARAILSQLESPKGICALVDDKEARLALELPHKAATRQARPAAGRSTVARNSVG